MLVRAFTPLGVLLVSFAAAFGTVNAQTPGPDAATSTATATSVPSMPVADVTSEPATPLPQPERGMAVVGYIIQDTNGDGVRSAGDEPAQTLVQLNRVQDSKVGSGASLLSDVTGRFEFNDLSEGEYILTLWWSPGFITLQGQPDFLAGQNHSDSATFRVTVASNGSASFKGASLEAADGSAVAKDIGSGPSVPFASLTFLVKPLPEGLIPYPVSSGGDSAVLPVGHATLPQVSMPSSGTPGGSSGPNRGIWLVSIGAVLFLATTALLLLRNRRNADT